MAVAVGVLVFVGTALSLYVFWRSRRKEKKAEKAVAAAVVAAEEGGVPGAPPVSFWKRAAF